MNIAIIPARGGSKRIPRKNIKEFNGRPMIAYSINAAKECGIFERVIVSTDDEEIADVALKFGAEVPFLRPEYLSDDYTGTTAVIRHAIEWIEKTESKIKAACCIYATAPFITANDLKEGLRILTENNSEYAFSVTNYAFPIQRALKISPDSKISMFNPEQFAIRSQDLEEAWHDAGQFYWGTKDAWLKEKIIFASHSSPIKLPRERVQDIDNIEDWKIAELMFKARGITDENSNQG